MKTFIQKLKSRKFLAALIGIVTGLAVAFGVDMGTIEKIAGMVMVTVTSISYIVVEGNIDAKAVKADAKAEAADQ